TAVSRLRHLPFEDLTFARIDHHRSLRQGHPEVIFCAGKTVEQVVAIAERLVAVDGGVLGTRANAEMAEAVGDRFDRVQWNALARTVYLPPTNRGAAVGTALVISAGTSDLPVAEEAAVTLEAFGHTAARLCDVGVAGIHRLLSATDRLQAA